MGEHLINGEFQSDKYRWCRRGFVPLKLTDPMAHPVLWAYAKERESVDREFADDLRDAMRYQGYFGPTENIRLMAAAKDLFEACVEQIATGDAHLQMIDAVNKALDPTAGGGQGCRTE